MANARELKNKIRSVTNTKKITRTMEMISTAKSRVCQKRIEAVQPYGDKLAALLRDLRDAGGADRFPLLRQPEKVKREVVYVVSANRGFCGGYNTNVLNGAEKYLRRREAEGVEVEVHMMGKKGITRFRYSGREVAEKYTQFEDKPMFAEAEEVLSTTLERFTSEEIDAVTMLFTHYVNATRQTAVERTLLPLTIPEGEGEEGGGADFIFEPSPEAILDTLLPLSLKTQLFQALVEAAASEQIARRIAMKNATDNAEEMTRTYTQLYNRTRQAGITQEILEIIGGAEVLS